tara:strand:- start:15 stop:299 length:285 start_codon:yes stop_codon:yes gene_type:complete
MAFKMHGMTFHDHTRNEALGGVSHLKQKNQSRIPVPDSMEVGSLVSEDWLDSQFKLKAGDDATFPQLSVQDFSKVLEDSKGKYVRKLKDTESYR